MHIIFSKLDFKDKIKAGLACKQWDQLLKAGTPAARHWDIDYSVKRIEPNPGVTKKFRRIASDHPSASVARYALCA
jgi:hypothetical protein